MNGVYDSINGKVVLLSALQLEPNERIILCEWNTTTPFIVASHNLHADTWTQGTYHGSLESAIEDFKNRADLFRGFFDEKQ